MFLLFCVCVCEVGQSQAKLNSVNVPVPKGYLPVLTLLHGPLTCTIGIAMST